MTTSNLRDRAAQATGSEVAQRNPAAELKDNIRKLEDQFQMAMPKGVEAKQLVRDALTIISANPKLLECQPASVYGSLMTCAQLGLRPGVLGQAWILPMRIKGQLKGQLIVGYQGFIALAHRSKDIASISARIVYERDIFDYEFGLEDRLVHKPTMGKDRGDAIAYYCIIKTQSGGTLWDVLSRNDAEAHRDKFAMAKTQNGLVGPWKDHFDAMALKTVILRVLKLAPRSTDLMAAMAADESFRLDTNPTADLVDVSVREDDANIVDGELVDENGVIHEQAPEAAAS